MTLGVLLAGCRSASGPGVAARTTEASRPTTIARAADPQATTITSTTDPEGTTITSATAPVGSASPPSSAGATAPCGRVAAPPSTYDHVIWIWMENHRFSQVIGDQSAPYETALARQCGTASRYATVGAPSLPNYIGATSGATQGISDDADPASHPLAVDNLFRQVRASGRTERSYEEAMPSACRPSGAGRYAVKHNPAAYYTGPGDRAACLSDDITLGTPAAGALRDDLSRGSLPAFAFITPDLCNDTHDCPVSVGDRWLAGWMPTILGSDAYRSGRTAVFVVWDEPTPMPNMVIGSSVAPGTVAAQAFDHYSLLRTTEELLGLSPFLGQAASATSMRPGLHL